MPRAACPIRADEGGFSYCPISMFIEPVSSRMVHSTVLIGQSQRYTVCGGREGRAVHIYSDFARTGQLEVRLFNLEISSNQCGRVQCGRVPCGRVPCGRVQCGRVQ